MSIDGRAEIQTKLKADSTVLSIVGTYKSTPAIYSIPLMPLKYQGNGVSMYLSGSKDGGSELNGTRNTCSCWATDYSTAEALQEAVYSALNRHSESNDTFFKCNKLQIISPNEQGGDYLAPVEVLVRKR